MSINMQESTDGRFQKVKVWIAHTGENLNNSYFEKETLESMVSTLPYIPIVGYIEEDKDGNEDFSDHRQELVIMENGIKMRYRGHAYGFIPQEPNAAFEFRDGKEWLTADGYIWTKFTDVTDIFTNSSGKKSQSMEIEDVEGTVDEAGRLVITHGSFSALCILGDNVPPAMKGSTVEYYTKHDEKTLKEELAHMILEFSKERSDLQLKDLKEQEVFEEQGNEPSESNDVQEDQTSETVDSLSESTEKEEADKEDEKVEDSDSEEEENSNESDESFNSKPVPVEEESGETEESKESEESDHESDEPEDSKESEEEFSESKSELDQETGLFMHKEFKISYENISHQIEAILENDGKTHYVIETYDNNFIAQTWNLNEDNGVYEYKYIKGHYDVKDGNVSIHKTEDVFPEFLTKQELQAIEINRAMYTKLEEEVRELKEYKQSHELTQKEELLKEFSSLDDKVLESIRDKFNELSTEEVQKELAFELYKTNADKEKNKKQTSSPVRVSKFTQKETCEYGDLAKYDY